MINCLIALSVAISAALASETQFNVNDDLFAFPQVLMPLQSEQTVLTLAV